ncbi:MAG TPA: metal ABC transporter permease [Tepidisphaeraceae bacterium]|nr:metal ABC transporter permease [Tepidisphaeraceae bacterium]
MLLDLSNPLVRNALLASAALALACSVLSLFVVARHWAFIGEGISHSGFGGAGTAWLLALFFPGLDHPLFVSGCVVVFCILTALAIGRLSRGQRVTSDAAIGIFLVASLAWGFLAQRVYLHFNHAVPVGFETLLFGDARTLGTPYAILTIAGSVAVLLTVAALGKEILAYCFDPQLAETSGVRGGLIHYLLMVLLGAVIVAGVRVVGSVLMTALLVLPGAAALLLSDRLKTALAWSVAIALVGAVGGVALSLSWPFVPAGAAIVLLLFVEFLVAYATSKVAHTVAPVA